MAFVYLALILGGITTLYPFVLMVSTGLKGTYDQNDRAVMPRFLREDAELLAKYTDDKYAGDAAAIASSRLGSDAPPATVERYGAFLRGLDPLDWTAGFRTAGTNVTSRLQARYQGWLRARFATIEELNRAYIEENVAFQTVPVPGELLDSARWRPPAGRKWSDWLLFKGSLPAEFRLPLRAERAWQLFWRGKARNQFDAVPTKTRGAARTFEELRPDPADPAWSEFQAGLPERLRGASAPDARWAALGLGPMPIARMERAEVARRSGELRGEFATRNVRYVLDYILINGRAVWNTVVFCTLAILVQLVVNPLAAYGLSRYPVRASGQILIFMLATMAFPAEVAMIPSFLLLKDLGLLNTFAALVLPTAASGYMIFLLKGFFDSLPQELFEAGQLDGAQETTLLWRVALPLSRPVLGYLALTAFMASYGAFLYAFLVAQDQRMWTLMVWLYQLQTTAPKAVTMAALALAALPTLLVFLLAQRVIMKGIVLPGER